ncbi:protein-tyrosine phosphatase family protein [Alkalicoccus chagannorensis]|uniref:protein-tyrosine phosphatase family protein n=1 Tax=Alkalicoccus chagannorensis TaxID=427072 RepID=UPI0004177684|nr:dual specificity protein phosphatase family protein [Alkalicoccus chagannorensis]
MRSPDLFNTVYLFSAKEAEEHTALLSPSMVIDLRLESDPSPGKAHIPMEDGREGQQERIREAVRLLVQCIAEENPVILHCQGGSSRTGCAAAALLLEKGSASSVDEAESMLQKLRPSIAISPALKNDLRSVYE